MFSNYFYYDPQIEYPTESPYYPETIYPEYPFFESDKESGINDSIMKTSTRNDVYGAIRALLKNVGFDDDHFGTPEWNPLGEFIVPGQTVLIKPNLVNHKNPAEDDYQKGMDCLITHPSVVRCLFDYVFIALKGDGKIIIADAPVQGCEFDALMKNTGYGRLSAYLCKKTTNRLKVIFADLRETVFHKADGVSVQSERTDILFSGLIVDLGKDSYFNSVTDKFKLRITDYDYKDTVKHHTSDHNEYSISSAILEADVVINVPKPKTHRIAGFTGALKNLIGANTRKEYLPHHQAGAISTGGDEYTDTHRILKDINSKSHDYKNRAVKLGQIKLQKLYDLIGRKTGKLLDIYEPNRDKNGMWFRNDTIWRTILDVNKAVLLADKNGMICRNPQRKILHFGDMVVCGDHEGPLRPSYKKVGGILFSENAIEFDRILVRIMGFDYRAFPVLKNIRGEDCLINGINNKEIVLTSNSKDFCKEVEHLSKEFQFVPSYGWLSVL